MKVTTFNNDGSIKNIKNLELAIPKQVLSYNDIAIFYNIPEIFILSPYINIKKQYDDFDFIKNRLEFLLKYDFSCYYDTSLALNIPSRNLTTDKEVMSACKNLLDETGKALLLHSVYGDFFRDLFAMLSDSSLEIECHTRYECQIADKMGVLFLKALQFIKSYVQKLDITQSDSLPISDHDILAAYLKPFFPSKSINSEFSNTDFLISVAKALLITKGRDRSVLFKIIQILNAIRLGDTSIYHANNTLMAYQGGASFQIASNGTRTVNIGNNTEVSYSISECAAIISSTESLSSEDYDKVISDIRTEYELHKKNNAFLKDEFDSDCKSQTDKHDKLYKENWVDYKKKVKEGWETVINTTSTRKRLNPIVCFYRLILKHDKQNGFFSDEFIQDFINLCTRNNPFNIAPELFDEMFLLEYINERIKNTQELLPKKASDISGKEYILSFSEESYLSDIYIESLENSIQEIKSIYGNVLPHALLNIIINEYNKFKSDEKIFKTITRELNNKLYTINNGVFDSPECWGKLYNYIYSIVESECKNAKDLDSTPWCYYRCILKHENTDSFIDFNNTFMFNELSTLIDKNNGKNRSLLYKLVFVLNYIKKHNNTSPNEAEFIYPIETASPIVQEVLVFLEPICNSTYINYNILSSNGFKGLMSIILENSLFSTDLTRKRRDGYNFDTYFILNILGVLYKNLSVLKGGAAEFTRALFPDIKSNDSNKYRLYVASQENRLNIINQAQFDFIKTAKEDCYKTYNSNKDRQKNINKR